MITSLRNPRVKAARALHRRRVRERENKILLEGVHLVHDAIAAGVAFEALFYTPEQEAHIPHVLRPQAWMVSERVMQALSGTVTPQGIVAVVERPALAWPTHPTLLLIADGVRDPGNLGTLLRAAAGAGVEGVLLPKGTVDAWSPKVLRAGMGAHFRLPLRTALTWGEIEQVVQGMRLYVADAHGATRYFEVDWREPSVLVVGGETTGPSTAAQAFAHAVVSIPLARDVESLNAAMAGTVILFEARRQRLIHAH
nr:RNA methyltransferase [Ardenticatena sp.]